MKRGVLALAIALLVVGAAAQSGSAVVAVKPGAQKEMQKAPPAAPDKEVAQPQKAPGAMKPCWRAKQWRGKGAPPCMAGRPEGKPCYMGSEARSPRMQRGERGHWPIHSCRALKAVGGMMFLGMLLCAAVNILLTILVTVDMARLGRFNGIWIPILLVAGLPGSVIYALFRIGDNLAETKAKNS
jgi:hypothetical protein